MKYNVSLYGWNVVRRRQTIGKLLLSYWKYVAKLLDVFCQ